MSFIRFRHLFPIENDRTTFYVDHFVYNFEYFGQSAGYLSRWIVLSDPGPLGDGPRSVPRARTLGSVSV